MIPDEHILAQAADILKEMPGPMTKGHLRDEIVRRLDVSYDEAMAVISVLMKRDLLRSDRTDRGKELARREKELHLDLLDSVVGLTGVKDEVRRIAGLAWADRQRRRLGVDVPDISYHMVLSGNPGTGKTTVARILGQIFRELGILSSGHLVEADRSALVSHYVGDTALKTNALVDSAMGGILFIDEAYSLMYGNESSSFADEAVATLLKRMEDNRDDLVVILAGYTDEMEAFLESNPGLKSRFRTHLKFPDYNPSELTEIFIRQVLGNGMQVENRALARVKAVVTAKLSSADRRTFGNGRYARNLFESALSSQAIRLMGAPNVTKRDLMILRECDIMPV